jgi:hypothetical protein
MRHAFAALADAALFALLLYAAALTGLLLAGTLEIAFGWNILLTRAGGIATAAVIMAAAVALHFVLPRRRHGATPGASLLAAPPRRALRWYGIALGAMLACCLAIGAVSNIVYGALVAAQQRRLASPGLPRQWGEIMPAYAAENNAAQYFYDTTLAFTGLNGIGPAFTMLKEHPDSAAAVERLVRSIQTQDGPALTRFERGLACSALLYADYRAASPDTLYNVRIPNYLRVQSASKLYAARATLAARRGDWAAAGVQYRKLLAVARLLAQDPILIGVMVQFAQQGIIGDGLIMMVKYRGHDPRCQALVSEVCDALPPVAGRVRAALNAESVATGALIDRLARQPLPRELFTVYSGATPGPGAPVAGILLAPLYHAWKRWDQYCWLRHDEYALKMTDPANGRAAADSLRAASDRFRARRHRLPALFASIAAPDPVMFYGRELECRALPGMVRLFAAAADFQRTNGRYPATAGELVPKYFPSLPQSPIDGGDYLFVNDGNAFTVKAPGGETKSIPTAATIDIR